MARGYVLEWTGVSAEAFSRLVQAVGWQASVLDGKVVYDRENGGRVIAIGVWPDHAEFSRFYTRRLLPALGEVGMPKPTVSSWEIPGAEPVSITPLGAARSLQPPIHFDPHAGQNTWIGEVN